MLFKNKYIKYKKKYLDLKNQQGGVENILHVEELKINHYYIMSNDLVGKLIEKKLLGNQTYDCIFQKTSKDNKIHYNITNGDIIFIELKSPLNNNEYNELSEKFKIFYISDGPSSTGQHYGYDDSIYNLKIIIDEDDIKKIPELIKKVYLTLNEFNIIQKYGTESEINNTKIINNYTPTDDYHTYRNDLLYINIDKYIKKLQHDEIIIKPDYDLLDTNQKKYFCNCTNNKLPFGSTYIGTRGGYISLFYIFSIETFPHYYKDCIKNTIYEKCIQIYRSASGNNRDENINIFSKLSLEYAKNHIDNYVNTRYPDDSTNEFYKKQYNEQKIIYNNLIKNRNKLIKENPELIQFLNSLELENINTEIIEIIL